MLECATKATMHASERVYETKASEGACTRFVCFVISVSSPVFRAEQVRQVSSDQCTLLFIFQALVDFSAVDYILSVKLLCKVINSIGWYLFKVFLG